MRNIESHNFAIDWMQVSRQKDKQSLQIHSIPHHDWSCRCMHAGDFHHSAKWMVPENVVTIQIDWERLEKRTANVVNWNRMEVAGPRNADAAWQALVEGSTAKSGKKVQNLWKIVKLVQVFVPKNAINRLENCKGLRISCQKTGNNLIRKTAKRICPENYSKIPQGKSPIFKNLYRKNRNKQFKNFFFV